MSEIRLTPKSPLELVGATAGALQAWMVSVLTRLEALESQARSPITAKATTDNPSDAPDGRTAAPILLSLRVRGVLTDQERIHVEQCFECKAALEKFVWQLSTRAPVVSGISSIFQRPASSEFVGQASDAATSPSGETSPEPCECGHGEGRHLHSGCRPWNSVCTCTAYRPTAPKAQNAGSQH